MKPLRPPVTVIIPTYNCSLYIEKCVKSVLDQTLKGIEIIVVDDCSSDCTVDLIPKNFNIQIIKNSERLGSGLSRNCGINHSIGEYVAFLDGDDFYPNANSLEKLYNRYGFFGEKTLGFEVKGVDGGKIIEDIMGRLKNNFSNELKGLDILKVYDYLNSTVFDSRNGKVINEDLPHSNIIRFDLKDNCKIIVRPSGTEPKIKFYLIMQANSRENLEIYKSTAKKIVERIMEK